MRGNVPVSTRTLGICYHVTKTARESDAHVSQNGSEVVALNALVEFDDEDSPRRKFNLEEIQIPDPVVLIFAVHASKGHNYKLFVAVNSYRKKNDVLEHARSFKSSVTHHDPQSSMQPPWIAHPIETASMWCMQPPSVFFMMVSQLTTDIDLLFVALIDVGFLGSSVAERHRKFNMLLVLEEIIHILEENRGVGASGKVAMITRSVRPEYN
jgi:hypothetical protein